jgi:tripartite ATP-independent transporter DctM subunit
MIAISKNWRFLYQWDAFFASTALAGMVFIPVIEVLFRPFQGSGIDNAPILVQHLGLFFSLAGAIYAERTGHLTSLGSLWKEIQNPLLRQAARTLVFLFSTFVCGLLAQAGYELMLSEFETSNVIAYGIPVWVFLSFLPIGFLILGGKFGMHWHDKWIFKIFGVGIIFLAAFYASNWIVHLPMAGTALGLVLIIFLILGGPIFVVLGGLSWLLFTLENIPMASLALSHYQITVNPSLPALPLFTLAGLIFANTKAANRLSQLFISAFGTGQKGTVFAVACLCSCFTALTGGSGVTILALGGLMLPLLLKADYPESKSIGLITSASSLGVLLAPSVPLIMYAIMARVPINTMFIAGLVPAVLMVFSLIIFGGFLNSATPKNSINIQSKTSSGLKAEQILNLRQALWNSKWEIFAPFIAIGSLISGLATPTEGAAVTVAYALITQGLIHRELKFSNLQICLTQAAQIIGGILLIMGMALGITNYLIDVGIPDVASDWVQGITSNKYVFLLALNIFLFFAGALMEIYAAIIVLVPLLLPLAMSYGIDPIHFGIIFLANLEMGFLCPPAGMNIYFASAVFKKSLREVIRSVMPALVAIFIGTVVLSWFPIWVMALPQLIYGTNALN